MVDLFYRKADLGALPNVLPDPELLVDQVETLIQDRMGRVPAQCALQTLSTYHYVYSFLIDGRPYILKIAKNPDITPTLSLEHAIYTNLLPLETFIPKVVDFDGEQKYFYAPYMILEFAQGKMLRDIPFDAFDYAACIESCGDVIARIHRYEKEGYGLVDGKAAEQGVMRGSRKSWKDFMLCQWDEHVAFTKEHGVITQKECVMLDEAIARFTPVLEAKEAQSLLHGDLGSHNIFIHQGRVSTIIDWEDVLIGDPLYDLAMFISFFRMHEFIGPLFKGYRQVSGMTVSPDDPLIWFYYARICVAKSVLRLKLGYDTSGQSLATPKIQFALSKLEQG